MNLKIRLPVAPAPLFFAGFFAIWPLSVSSQTIPVAGGVNAPSARVADHLYALSATQALNTTQDYGTAAGVRVLVDLYRDNPRHFNPVTAVQAVNQIRDRYQTQIQPSLGPAYGMPPRQSPTEAYSNAALEVFGIAGPLAALANPTTALPAAAIGVGVAASRALGPLLNASEALTSSRNQIPAQFAASLELAQARAGLTQTFLDARAIARASPNFARAIQAFVGSRVANSILASASEITDPSINPTFAMSEAIRALRPHIRPDGLHMSQAQVDAIIAQVGGALQRGMAEERAILRRAAAEISQSIAHPPGASTAQSIRAAQEARRIEELNRQRANETLVATANIGGFLIGLGNPQAGRVFSGVSIAAIKINEIVSKLSGSQITGAALAIATGDVLGAVTSVLSLFGPSETQQILMGINELKRMVGAISQQLTDMNTYNQARFDHIDRSLSHIISLQVQTINAIYRMMDQMQQQHTEVMIGVRDIQERLGQLHELTERSYVGLQRAQNEQSAYLRSFFSDAQIRTCLGQGRARGATRAIDEERFLYCLNLAYALAANSTVNGSGGVSSDVSASDPAEIRNQLAVHRARPGTLTGYLPRVAAEFLGVPIALAQPPLLIDHWLDGSEQLLQLLYLLPRNRETIATELLATPSSASGMVSALRAEGERIEALFGRIYLTGNPEAPGDRLWTRLEQNYRQSLERVFGHVSRLASDYEVRQMHGVKFYQDLT